MKHLKWLVPLAVVVLILMTAIPAAADDPFGGPPSKNSGDGTTTWGAIYIGGTWDNKCDPASGYGYPNPNTFSMSTGVVSTKEYDCYVTNWSKKITVPALSTRWFKFDTVSSRDVELYVDDQPKWGAAYRYFDPSGCVANGTGSCDASDNLLRLGIDTGFLAQKYLAVDDRYDFVIGDKMFRNGFTARVYPTQAIRDMDYYFPTPNNLLLTERAGSRVRTADTLGSRGGYGRGNASPITVDGSAGGWNTYTWLENGDVKKAGDGNTHLLAGKIHDDGWIYVRVGNNMYWDGDMVIGTRYTPRPGFDFPCANCPYPFDPNHK